MKKLIGLVGSTSDQSTNRLLLQFMATHFKDLAAIELVEIKHLPLFNKPANYTVLPEVQVIADKIKAADGVIIATPEHDHAPTAALNNALAWLSYKIYPFVAKAVMIVGASYSSLGSSRAQIQLQQLLEAPELKAYVMPGSEYLLPHSLKAFDAQGQLVHKSKVSELERLFNNFLEFVDLIKQLPQPSEMGSETTAKYIWDTPQKKAGSKMKLVGIVGSNAEKSYNRLLLNFIKKECSDLFELEILNITDLPLFTPNEEQAHSKPIQYLSRKISEADGVIVATPEHNRTIPPALKSLFEWLSFKTHPFKEQPVLIVGASYFDQGTSRAQTHLRQILEAPGVEAFTFPGDEFLLGQAPEAFDQNGNIKAQDTIDFLRKILEKFVRYIEVVKGPAPHVKNNMKLSPEGVDKKAEIWVEQMVKKANAVEGDAYVELNRGLLTVNQVNYLLNAMPFEVSYLDKNSQYLYQDKIYATSHSDAFQKNVEYAFRHLRMGNMDTFRINAPVPESGKFLMHQYQAVRTKEGKFLGINKQVRDIQPIIDWYLEETGQELVDDEAVSPIDTPAPTASMVDHLTEAASVDAVSAATENY